MAEAGPSRGFSSPSQYHLVDLIPPALIMNAGWMKYATIKMYGNDHNRQPIKYILRGYRHSRWTESQFTTADQLPDGPDAYVLNRLKTELDPYGIPYEVIGWGKLLHDSNEKTVTFREEGDIVKSIFNGHSEQCYWARVLIKWSASFTGYDTFHVFRNGQLSPHTIQRLQLTDQ